MDPMDIDSDFYGDEETVSVLQARVDSFDPGRWRQGQKICNIPVLQGNEKSQPPTGHLHNPYAGVHYAWQLEETVDGFLNRLPPATTDTAPDLEWIYICNPHIPRKEMVSAENQLVRGCENEAPLDFQTQLGTFLEGGTERLHLLRDFIERTNASYRAKAVIDREVDVSRSEAIRDILALAHMLHVRAGKWMLFPEPTEVDDVWAVVARATANNELGIAAKVAPRVREAPTKARLVCIYTADFADKDDVGRVLGRMKNLGLWKPGGRPIYYKCDAYTYLGISSGNVWTIRPSLYSSSEIFARSNSLDKRQ